MAKIIYNEKYKYDIKLGFLHLQRGKEGDVMIKIVYGQFYIRKYSFVFYQIMSQIITYFL